jgi:hypothetical protein
MKTILTVARYIWKSARLAVSLRSALTTLLLSPLSTSAEMEEQIANPQTACSPGIFWYWLNGYVTVAGIDADLEAMMEAGIGNVMLFNIKHVFIEPNPAMEPLEVHIATE